MTESSHDEVEARDQEITITIKSTDTPDKGKYTVDENIIATTKIRNNYITIQSFSFPILR